MGGIDSCDLSERVVFLPGEVMNLAMIGSGQDIQMTIAVDVRYMRT